MTSETSECRDMKQLVAALLAAGEQRASVTPERSQEFEIFSFRQTRFGLFIQMELGFEALIDKIVSLKLFADPGDFVFRVRGHTWFKDGVLTKAGRSHFGGVFRRQRRLDFKIGAAAVRFRVKGNGNNRRFEISSHISYR